jgi:CRISPR-associated endonuclease Csn1
LLAKSDRLSFHYKKMCNLPACGFQEAGANLRIFGLDIGTTSIGFVVVDLDEGSDRGKIVQAGGCPGLGVRIFPEARDPDGTPLNQQRRAKRMMRRQLRRRRKRRRSLGALLAAHGLLPAFGSDEWAKIIKADPYALRDRAIGGQLEPHELGRALYHLAKHRHFRERDLAEAGEADTAKDKKKPEEEAETNDRDATVAALRAKGVTLGQWLARKPDGEKRRGIHATRAIVEEEFARLCDTQAAHHAVLRDETLRAALEEAVFAQRPVFWRKSTLGSCRFAPGAPLCPKGSWLSQQRRMLEKVNNLAIAGGNARPLDAEERAAILAALQTQKSMGWPGVRKTLDPLFKARGESTKYIRFNLEYGDEKGGLKGNIVEADLAKIFGSHWDHHPHKEKLRAIVPEALWQADYGEIGTQRVVIRGEKERAAKRAALVGRLVQEFGATQEQAQGIIKLTFPQGWEPYSTRALEAFLPELEKGVRFGALVSAPEWETWRNKHFPNRERPTGEILDKLPSPNDQDEARRIARIRNPTVVRVQNELRKVVNNLIRVYGKPDLIRVELARGVGKSKREREEITAGMRRQERRRNEARKDLESNGIADPSRDDIEKWMLWKESQERCPYTGDQIGFDDLFRANRYQIEHIWPRSLSLDDSFRNKTLCRQDINIAKGNRIPFDYYRGRPEEWQAVKDRVWKMVGRDGLTPGKAKRFCAEAMPDDFANRQLTDTSYAARQAVAFLKRLWPDEGPTARVTVQPVTGRVTAHLRKLWELNYILADDGEKTRADHRHHAIDALVVACTHPGMTQRLSAYFQDERFGKHPHLPAPWPLIRKDAAAAVANIVVSHRVRKKVSGPLHMETIYGDTREDITNSNGTYRMFVTRKPLERLSKGELEQIVDDRVREIVIDWIAKHGGDPKKAFGQFPRVSEGGPEIRKVRLAAPQKMRAMAQLKTGFATTGNNHHIAIYRLPSGKIDHAVVSLYDAIKRIATRQPIVQRSSANGGRLIMSLSLGDTFQIPPGDKAGYWTVKSISGNGQIFSKPINNADPSASGTWGPSPAPLVKLSAKKIAVDPIGQIRPSND